MGGYAEQRARLQRLVEWPQAQGGHSRRLGVEPPSGALLYGPSGNGKSLLVHALASSCGCSVLSAKGSQLFGEFPSSFLETGDVVISRNGRLIPTTPWESVWSAVGEWWGLTEAERATVLPHAERFSAETIFAAADLFDNA